MSNSREVSQFSNFIVVDDSNRNIGIATTATPFVGIGTTNPKYKLDIIGDLNFTGTLRKNGSEYVQNIVDDTTPQLGGNLDLNGNTIYGVGGINITGVITATSYYGDGSKLTGISGGVSITTNTTNNNQLIPYVTSTGSTTGFGVTADFIFNPSTESFGIGTTNPTNKLDVRGTAYIETRLGIGRSDSTYPLTVNGPIQSFPLPAYNPLYPGFSGLEIYNGASGGWFVGVETTGDNDLRIRTSNSTGVPSLNSVPAIEINRTTLNVGIGTSNPASRLHVEGGLRVTGVSTLGTVLVSPGIITATSGVVTYYGDGSKLTGISGGLSITDDTSTNETRYILFDDVTTGTVTAANVSSTKLTFNPSSGNLVAGGTVTANSDEKLKTNIKTIDNALEKVLSLRGVEYDRIDTGEHQIGVIAQEVEQIVPDVVYPKSAPDYETKSVAYGNLVGLLIEAIKEQNQKIAELERRLGRG